MLSLPADNFRSPAALARFLLVAAIGLVADLGTKVWAFKALAINFDGRPYPDRAYDFIPGWLRFEVTTKPERYSGWEGQPGLFIASPSRGGFLTVWFARRTGSGSTRSSSAAAAGVMGNMYDPHPLRYVRT